MEQYPPAVNNEREKKPHRLTALAFLEIGLFEIVFVTVGVLLLLGTINYFNLLPVSKVFPKYLGWLPRQQTKIASQGETLQSYEQKSTSVPRPTATPTPPVSPEFISNTLKPYVSSVLNPAVAYSIQNILQLQNKDNLKKDIAVNMDTDEGAVSGILQLSKDKENFSLVNLSFSKTYPISSSIDLETMKKDFSIFFSAVPKGEWKCKTLEPSLASRFCENFWEEENEENNKTKKGLYFQDPVSVDNRTKEKKVNFSFCEFRKDSDRFLWKSCLQTFSKEGISP